MGQREVPTYINNFTLKPTPPLQTTISPLLSFMELTVTCSSSGTVYSIELGEDAVVGDLVDVVMKQLGADPALRSTLRLSHSLTEDLDLSDPSAAASSVLRTTDLHASLTLPIWAPHTWHCPSAILASVVSSCGRWGAVSQKNLPLFIMEFDPSKESREMVSETGRNLLAASSTHIYHARRDVLIINVETGEDEGVLYARNGEPVCVTHLAVSPCRQKVVAAYDDWLIAVLPIANPGTPLLFPSPGSYVYALCLTPTVMLCSGGSSQCVLAYDGVLVRKNDGYSDIPCMAVSYDYKRVVLAYGGGRIRICDVGNVGGGGCGGDVQIAAADALNAVRSVVFSRSGESLFVCRAASRVAQYDSHSGVLLRKLGPSGVIHCTPSPCDCYIFLATRLSCTVLSLQETEEETEKEACTMSLKFSL